MLEPLATLSKPKQVTNTLSKKLDPVLKPETDIEIETEAEAEPKTFLSQQMEQPSVVGHSEQQRLFSEEEQRRQNEITDELSSYDRLDLQSDQTEPIKLINYKPEPTFEPETKPLAQSAPVVVSQPKAAVSVPAKEEPKIELGVEPDTAPDPEPETIITFDGPTQPSLEVVASEPETAVYKPVELGFDGQGSHMLRSEQEDIESQAADDTYQPTAEANPNLNSDLDEGISVVSTEATGETIEFSQQLFEAIEQLDEDEQETSYQLFDEIIEQIDEYIQLDGNTEEQKAAIKAESEIEEMLIAKTTALIESVNMDCDDQRVMKFIKLLVERRGQMREIEQNVQIVDKAKDSGTKEFKGSAYLNSFVHQLQAISTYLQLGRFTLRQTARQIA